MQVLMYGNAMETQSWSEGQVEGENRVQSWAQSQDWLYLQT